MSARDIASEIITLTKQPDKPSPLVLVVYSRSTSSSSRGPRDFRNENETMRITAPTIDGEVIFRISFPLTNYTTVDSEGHLSNMRQSQRTVLEYKLDNIQGAASCVEGYMSYRDQRDIMLFPLNGSDLGPFPLGRWCFDESRGGLNDPKKLNLRLTVIQQVLLSLLVA
eukprot:scaffold80153_cov77-Cyclotella_meneghiniana.AAC.3